MLQALLLLQLRISERFLQSEFWVIVLQALLLLQLRISERLPRSCQKSIELAQIANRAMRTLSHYTQCTSCRLVVLQALLLLQPRISEQFLQSEFWAIVLQALLLLQPRISERLVTTSTPHHRSLSDHESRYESTLAHI